MLGGSGRQLINFFSNCFSFAKYLTNNCSLGTFERKVIFAGRVIFLVFFAEKVWKLKNNSYICGIACEPGNGWAAGGLIYEKDVFECLSL